MSRVLWRGMVAFNVACVVFNIVGGFVLLLPPTDSDQVCSNALAGLVHLGLAVFLYNIEPET